MITGRCAADRRALTMRKMQASSSSDDIVYFIFLVHAIDMKVSSAENTYFTSVSISPVVMETPSVNLSVTWYDSEGLGSAGYLNSCGLNPRTAYIDIIRGKQLHFHRFSMKMMFAPD